jgi:inorganic pyrophosphatase
MSKNFWHDIETGIDIPEIINVVVEIPKGSMNKYEYDKKHNMIKLDRVLFSPFHYPGDYGIVPQTLSEDGDPLDARYLHTADISNIEDHNRSEIAHFFQVYKDLEGKKVEIIGWESSKEAKQVIVESIKRYRDTLKKY